jgi:hypothetical protein
LDQHDLAIQVSRLAEAKADRQTRFLPDLIRIRSCAGQEKPAVERTLAEMRAVCCDEVGQDFAGNALGRIGRGPRVILYNAHLDTDEVASDSEWPHPPLEPVVEGETMFGLGASDCKGGVAAIVYGAAILRELLNGSSGFMGGTVFTGMTCSALTAVVVVLGLMLAEIENSHLRVLRMIGTMAIRGDALADDFNAFSKIMNLGNRLSQWLTTEFGSTQCGAITQCDVSTTEGRYINDGGTARCNAMAQSVAHRVLGMIQSADSAECVQGGDAKIT